MRAIRTFRPHGRTPNRVRLLERKSPRTLNSRGFWLISLNHVASIAANDALENAGDGANIGLAIGARHDDTRRAARHDRESLRRIERVNRNRSLAAQLHLNFAALFGQHLFVKCLGARQQLLRTRFAAIADGEIKVVGIVLGGFGRQLFVGFILRRLIQSEI